MLIIGLGNPNRADDAAGVLVARRLRALGVPAVENCGDVLELLDQWEGHDHVVVVDAAVDSPGGEARPATSTHGFEFGGLLELARVTGRFPAELLVLGIAAANFTPGDPPSREVLDAVESLSDRLARSVASYSGGSFAACFDSVNGAAV